MMIYLCREGEQRDCSIQNLLDVPVASSEVWFPLVPPPLQSSRELLQLFSQRYLAGEGDVIRHLAQMGYTVAHTQVSLAGSSPPPVTCLQYVLN